MALAAGQSQIAPFLRRLIERNIILYTPLLGAVANCNIRRASRVKQLVRLVRLHRPLKGEQQHDTTQHPSGYHENKVAPPRRKWWREPGGSPLPEAEGPNDAAGTRCRNPSS